MIRVVHPRSRNRMLTFFPSRIPDPGVTKGTGSGSATLFPTHISESWLIIRNQSLEPSGQIWSTWEWYHWIGLEKDTNCTTLLFPLLRIKTTLPDSELQDPVSVLLVLLVLAFVEPHLPVHLFLRCSGVELVLCHTVHLPILIGFNDFVVRVCPHPLGASEDPFLDALFFVPVVVGMHDDTRQHVFSEELARLPTWNWKKKIFIWWR